MAWMTSEIASPDDIAMVFRVPAAHRRAPLTAGCEPRFAYKRLRLADRMLRELHQPGVDSKRPSILVEDPPVRIDRASILGCLRISETSLNNWAVVFNRALRIPSLDEWLTAKSSEGGSTLHDCRDMHELTAICDRYDRQRRKGQAVTPKGKDADEAQETPNSSHEAPDGDQKTTRSNDQSIPPPAARQADDNPPKELERLGRPAS